jgi:hypothetical protein
VKVFCVKYNFLSIIYNYNFRIDWKQRVILDAVRRAIKNEVGQKKIVGAVDVFVQCVHKINVCLWLKFILGILMRF